MGNLFSVIDRKYFSKVERPRGSVYDVSSTCRPVGNLPPECSTVPWNVIKAPSVCKSCVDTDMFVMLHDFSNTSSEQRSDSKLVTVYQNDLENNDILFWVILGIMLLSLFANFDRYFVVNYFFQLGNGLIFRFIIAVVLGMYLMYVISGNFYDVPPVRTEGMFVPRNTKTPIATSGATATASQPAGPEIANLSAKTTNDRADLLGGKHVPLLGMYFPNNVDIKGVSGSTFNTRFLLLSAALFSVFFIRAAYGNAAISNKTNAGSTMRIILSIAMFYVAYTEVVQLGYMWWSDVLKIFGIAVLANIIAALVYNGIFSLFTPVDVSANPLQQGTKIVKFNSIYRSWAFSVVMLGILVSFPYLMRVIIKASE